MSYRTWLFSPSEDSPSSLEVIKWWEVRRLSYNVFMLCIGIISLLWFFTAINAAGLPPGEDAVEPLGLFFGVPLFAIMANVCYTGGWMLELTIRQSRQVSKQFGPKLLKFGMAFSFCIVSFPAIIWTIILLLTFFGYEPFAD